MISKGCGRFFLWSGHWQADITAILQWMGGKYKINSTKRRLYSQAVFINGKYNAVCKLAWKMGFITWHTYFQIGYIRVFLRNVLQTQNYELNTDTYGWCALSFVMLEVGLQNHSGVFKIYKYRACLVIKSSHTSKRKGSYCLPFMEWEIRHSFTPVIIIFSTYGFIMAHCVEKLHSASHSWKRPWLIFNLSPGQNSPKCVVVHMPFPMSAGRLQRQGWKDKRSPGVFLGG